MPWWARYRDGSAGRSRSRVSLHGALALARVAGRARRGAGRACRGAGGSAGTGAHRGGGADTLHTAHCTPPRLAAGADAEGSSRRDVTAAHRRAPARRRGTHAPRPWAHVWSAAPFVARPILSLPSTSLDHEARRSRRFGPYVLYDLSDYLSPCMARSYRFRLSLIIDSTVTHSIMQAEVLGRRVDSTAAHRRLSVVCTQVVPVLPRRVLRDRFTSV